VEPATATAIAWCSPEFDYLLCAQAPLGSRWYIRAIERSCLPGVYLSDREFNLERTQMKARFLTFLVPSLLASLRTYKRL
jgi:hypothetical protein